MSPLEEKEEPIFKVTKWAGVAFWSWDISVDNCAICRNHIMDLCIECQTKHSELEKDIEKDLEKDLMDKDGNREKCTVAWGVCRHAFHMHCISRWIKARKVCPLDNTPWEYMKND